jgi:hypothetical protein
MFPDEAVQVLDEALGWGKTTDTQRQQNPATGSRTFGWIIR